jgi:hypothetical protein
MKFLLFVRVLTITVIYLFVNKWNDELTAPLSIFSSIIHELGHSVGAMVSGGEVSGFTLAPDCPCLYACTRGGVAGIILLFGNLFTIATTFFFIYTGRIVSKITENILPVFIFLSLLMFLTVRLIGDERILSIWLVAIYILMFIFFILTRTSWAGAFLIFFGFFNLFLIVKDMMMGGVLSDISRYSRLTTNIHLPLPNNLPQTLDVLPRSFNVPSMFWFVLWFGIVGYIAVVLMMQVAETKVDWIEGRKFFKNTDFDKILLFLSILPNLVGFAIDQGLEFLLIEFKAIFNGIRSFLRI